MPPYPRLSAGERPLQAHHDALLLVVEHEWGPGHIMTNHPVYQYPDPSTFPEVPENKSYNTFHRYLVLADAFGSHEPPYSASYLEGALARVYAHADDNSEGAGRPFLIRTLWNVCLDLNTHEMMVTFCLRDGALNQATGDPTLIFSEPFTFRLKDAGALPFSLLASAPLCVGNI